MKDFLPFIVIGLANGAIYALAGMGLVLTFKTSGVFNFAHGAQAAAAAYLFYEFRERLHIAWPLAALISICIAGVLLGLILERGAYALQDRSLSAKITATVGLLVAIDALLVLAFGATALPFASFLPTHLIHLPDVNVGVDQIIIFALALVSAVGLWAFFKYRRLGIAIQAVVENPDLLMMQGVRATSVRRVAWIVGSCFAAVSGLILASTIGLDASILTLLVVQAFGAAAIGGFTSLVGTFGGGLVIGVLSALSTKWVGNVQALSQVPANVPFLVLFFVLIFRPSVLRISERTTTELRRLRQFPRQLTLPTMSLGALVLVLVPMLVGTNLPSFTEGLTFVILFASLSLLVNTSGQLSLCQMAFAAVGASTFTHLHAAGLPWPFALLGAGLVAVPVGIVVAIPAIRLSGVYLAIATLGFGILVERIFYTTFLMFGTSGDLAPPPPSLPGLHLGTETGYYYVVLFVTVLCLAAVMAVTRSRLGRLLTGLSQSPSTLTSHGVNTVVTKVLVFAISAFLAAIAGAMMGPITGSASNLSFDFSVSLILVAVLAIAGRRPVLGAFVAGGLYIVVPSYITSSNASTIFQLIFGVVAIAVVVAPSLNLETINGRWIRIAQRTPAGPIAARSLLPVRSEELLT
jgi:branched-subunit amino acid ABC-type transport system permease component